VVHYTVVSAKASQWLTFSALFGVLNFLSRTKIEDRADQIDYVADRVLRLLYRRSDRRCIHRVLEVLEPFSRIDLERKWVHREEVPANVLVTDATEIYGPRSDVAKRLQRMAVAQGYESAQQMQEAERNAAAAAAAAAAGLEYTPPSAQRQG
jgi:hypothetical protein